MRVSQQQMDSGHRRIVEGASRRMRERGLDGVSVAAAMGEAGMTHGGFYRHFATKDGLVAEALQWAFDEFAVPLEARQRDAAPRAVVDEYKALYLSPEHVAHPAQGCPMPALGAEVARSSPAIRQAFVTGVRRVIDAVSKAYRGSDEEREAAAMREVAMLVGAVVLARACDGETARGLLAACRR